jgi:hypothetical protein
MSANGPPPGTCGDAGLIRRLRALRERDDLDAAGQKALHAHLAACAVCRDEAVAADPTLLFVPLSASAASAEAGIEGGGRLPARWEEAAGEVEAERLAGDVLAAVRVRKTEGTRRAGPAGRRVLLRAAAVLLAAVGVAGLVVLSRSSDPARSGLAVLSTRGPEPPLAAAEIPSRALIEEVGTPGARVYEFAGRTPKEPTVVFVANPNADL